MLLVHHTDAEREFDYRVSPMGTPGARRSNEAQQRGWTVVSMKDDWKSIFSFESDARGEKTVSSSIVEKGQRAVRPPLASDRQADMQARKCLVLKPR